MKATKARAIAQRKEHVNIEYNSVIDMIEKYALNERFSLTWHLILDDETKSLLEADGYALMDALAQDGYCTIISW